MVTQPLNDVNVKKKDIPPLLTKVLEDPYTIEGLRKCGQIADAVVYLARAEAVTGQTIFVDGGAHLAPLGRDFVALERD